MPASIFITHRQLEVLAETGEDVVINEGRILHGPLDCWVLDGTSSGDHHRSMLIEQSGEVLSDSVVPDPDRAPHPGFSQGGPEDGTY